MLNKFVTTTLLLSFSIAVQISYNQGSMGSTQMQNSLSSFHGMGGLSGFNSLTNMVALEDQDSLSAVVRSYEERINFLETEIRRISRLSNGSDVDQQLLQDLQCEVDRLSMENEELRCALADSQNDTLVEELRNELAELTAKNVRQEAQLEILQAADVDSLREQIATLQRENNECKCEVAIFNAQGADIEKYREENTELKEKIKELEELNEELNKELDNISGVNTDNRKTIEEKISPGVVDKDSITALQLENDRLNQKIFELENLRIEKMQLEAEIKLLKNQIANLNERNSELQVNIEELEAENDDLNNQVNQLNRDKRNNEFEISRLKNSNEQFEQKIVDLEAELQESESNNGSMQNQLNQQRNDSNDLNMTIANLRNDLKRAEDELNRRQAEIEELRADNDKLEDQFREIQRSKSRLDNEIEDLNKQIQDLLRELDREAEGNGSTNNNNGNNGNGNNNTNNQQQEDPAALKRHFAIIIRNLQGQIKTLQQRVFDLEAQLGLTEGNGNKRSFDVNVSVQKGSSFGRRGRSSDIQDIINRHSRGQCKSGGCGKGRSNGLMIGSKY